MEAATPRFDVFVSHAGEDKAAIARPLTEALRARGISVWLDEDEMRLGDSLHQILDRALGAARFGVVVLSPSYFRKSWTRRELGALLALETELGRNMVLPVRHEVSQQEVVAFAPMLGDRIGVNTSEGIEEVAQQVAAVLRLEAGGDPATTPAEAGSLAAADERLLEAVPLALLAEHEEPILLAERGDGALPCLAFATGSRILVGRATAGQLQGKAAEAFVARHLGRVHWTLSWGDAAFNQLSLELGHLERGGRTFLAIENLTGYALRQTPMEVVEAGGRRHPLPPGGRLEIPIAGSKAKLTIELGGGRSRLPLEFERIAVGGARVPVWRSEGSSFRSPAEGGESRRVKFCGLWIPLPTAEIAELLRRSGADLEVGFADSRLDVAAFHHPRAGAMVAAGPDLEAALGL